MAKSGRRRRTGVRQMRWPATFPTSIGQLIRPGTVHGYYVDLRIKATSPGAPPVWPEARMHVKTTQWGLACFERHLAGEEGPWLRSAIAAGEHLVAIQRRDGPQEGGWVHAMPYPDTFATGPEWLSGLGQGQGASLLARLHVATGSSEFADAARRALLPLRRTASEGGVGADLGGGSFPQEYPTTPISHVLNGGIFAIWGMYDVGIALDDASAAGEFTEYAATLAENIHRWDVGFWSRYDLVPGRPRNLASPWYHRLHIVQLDAMQLLAPHAALAAARARFERYSASPWNVTRATLEKVKFRALRPRSMT